MASSKIKGITIEFNGDTTKLNSALKNINSATKSTSTELRSINNLLKFNPANTELLAQKQKALGTQITNTKEKLNALKAADIVAKKQLENGDLGQSDYDALRRDIIKTESQLNNFKNQLKKTNSQKMTALKSEMTKVGTKIKSVATVAKNFAIGLSAMGASALYAANSAAEVGDNVDKMSQKIGISAKAYQELDYAFSQSGADVDGLQTGMKTLAGAMQEADRGAATYTKTFDELGVSIYDTNGNLKDQETMFYDSVRALQKMEDGTAKAALAADLFGRSGSELMPLLNAEAGSFDKLTAKAEELGLVMSDDAVQASADYTDAMDDLQRSLKALGVEALIPIVKELAEYMIEKLPAIKKNVQKVINVLQTAYNWIVKNKDLIYALGIIIGGVAVAIGIFNIQQALMTTGLTVGAVATGVMTAAASALATVMAFLTSPITLVILAITALIAVGVLLYKNWDTISAKTKEVWGNIKSTIVDKLTAAKDAVKNIIDKIKALFDFEWHLPSLKLPHVNISGGFSISPPSAPKFNVDWYKDGGIFDKPTLFNTSSGVKGVGEAGAEAVLPLNTLWDKMDDRDNALINALTPILTMIAQNTMATVESVQSGSIITLNKRELARTIKDVT